eukprot:NODE_165_length_14629_cov_0.605231.p8 type:complete len:198 gc:universal NODE_165_length_14629_cov_0.605231:8616-9209(+)
MELYAAVSDSFIKESDFNSHSSSLFNYDAYVLKPNKSILTNHHLFEPNQLQIMDSVHPLVLVTYPKEIQNVPLEYWLFYTEKLKTFLLSKSEHRKSLKHLSDYMIVHKHNAIAFFAFINYIETFDLLESDFEYNEQYFRALLRYCQIDFLCDSRYINTLLESSKISLTDKKSIIERRSKYLKLNSEQFTFLANYKAM